MDQISLQNSNKKMMKECLLNAERKLWPKNINLAKSSHKNEVNRVIFLEPKENNTYKDF